MTATHLKRRVLLLADDSARGSYPDLSDPQATPATWDVLEADSFERARFVLQMEECDVLLLDASRSRAADAEGLPWLLAHHPLPVLFVSDAVPALILAALRRGASQWLPRDLALGQPAVLGATLSGLAEWGEARRRARVLADALRDSRRQVSRLVGLLWEATPTDGKRRWFSQRHMMDRLAQEVARRERYGGALSVVLGEVGSPLRPRPSAEEAHALAAWTAERVAPFKRRCDVAGQYGPSGFLLLLPDTSASGAAACCRRLQVGLERPESSAAAPVPQPRVYFGVAGYTPETATVTSLLTRAEQRLESARTGGAGQVVA